MKRFELVTYPKHDGHYKISIDNFTYIYSKVNLDRDGSIAYISRDARVNEVLLDCTLEELGESVNYISLDEEQPWLGFRKTTTICWERKNIQDEKVLRPNFVPTGKLEVSVSLEPVLVNWNRKYSFLQYASTFEQFLRTAKDVDSFKLYDDYDDTRITTRFVFDPSPEPLIKTVDEYLREVERIHHGVVNFLDERMGNQQVVASFDFPDALRIPCEQYLLYFSQFLKDLGIGANAQITELAGRVLFSVDPTGGVEALERIREALDIYLDLPSNPIIKSQESFAIQRLEYQVDSLKFQIRAAQSERRMLEREILHQDLLLSEKQSNVRRVISDDVLVTSRVLPSSDDSENTEKRMIGLTKIKKAEDWGLEIDLAEIFRRLRKKIGG